MAYLTIDEMYVASPCDVPWSSMTGDSTVRHCGECKKNVYKLSLLTRVEANQIIQEHEGNLCLQLYRRFDGTVLTADCPKGLRMIRVQYLKSRARVLAAIAAIVGIFGLSLNSCKSYMGVGPVPYSDTTHHVK